MTEFVQSKKGKITIAIIILVLLGLIIGMLLVKGPHDKDKDGNKVNIETDEPEREVFEKDENTVEETHKDGLTVVDDEDADVDSSDFAEFPEVDEDGNVIPSDDNNDNDNNDNDNNDNDNNDSDNNDNDNNDNDNNGVEGGNVENPKEVWGPFF